MTKERYRTRARVSAAAAVDAQPSRRHPHRRPFGRQFAALNSEVGDHPVDLAIARVPEVVKLGARLRRLHDAVQRKVDDNALFLRYEDTRTGWCVLHDELYFDAGFEHGRLDGMGRTLVLATPAVNDLQRKLRLLVMTAKMPRARVMALFLDVARALALGLDAPRRLTRRFQRAAAGGSR